MYVKTDYSCQMRSIRKKIYSDMVEIEKSLRYYKDLHERGERANYVSMEAFERHIADLQKTYDKYVAAYNAME